MTTVTSPEALSVHKLLQLPATFAWSFDPGHLSTIGCCGDIDGDGRDEFIVSSAQATSPVACLSVLSYVQPNELDPGWSDNQQSMLIVQWSSSAGIPNWMYPPSPAPQSCSNFSFWSADVDGDGIQEIIAFFPGYTGASASLGVLKWDNNSLRCVWQTIGVISGIPGTHSCPLAPGLRLYPMRSPAGEGGDRILFVQPVSGLGTLVGLMEWNAGAFSSVWLNNGSIPGAGNVPAWTLGPVDQFAVGDVDGDKEDELILLVPSYVDKGNPLNPALAVAKWSGGVLSVIWHVSSSAGNAPDYVTQSASVLVADLDGTGVAKIIIPMAEYKGMVVAEWGVPATLNVIWRCGLTVSGIDGAQDWEVNAGGFFGASDAFSVANLDGTGDALFIVQATNSGSAGVLKWQNEGLYCVWQGTANGWSLSYFNQHFPARLDGPGEVLLAFAPGASIGLLTWSSGNLTCLYQSQYYVSGWNLNLLAGLPATPFTPFTGTQLQLYQQLCMSLIPPALGADDETGDIRYQYGNLTNAGTFSGWATQIKDMTPLPGYTQEDWEAVAPVISAEAGWVGTMYGFSEDMVGLATAINIQQDKDLNHCFGNLTLDPVTSPAPVSYWAGAVIDAALWGLAAVPLGPEIQAGLAVVASLFGSFVGQPSSGGPPTTVVEYRDFKTTVDTLFSDALNGTYLDLQALVTDPVKLRVAGRLAEDPWYWGIRDNEVVAANGTNPNRIMFYQMLMAVEFSLFVWTNSKENSPIHRWLDWSGGHEETPIDAPTWAWWSIPNADGTYTVALLAQGTITEGGQGVNLVAFPIQALMTDLFTNLQVQPADVTFQRFGWDKIQHPSNGDAW